VQIRRLLVINPNTSEETSRSLDAFVRSEVGERLTVRTVAARFGYGYLASRAAVAIANHAVLDAAAHALADGFAPDVILLACFGDPGFQALAETTGVPVVGFAEAGLLAAARETGSFVVATKGKAWRGILAELALALGLADRISSIETIDDTDQTPYAIAKFLAARARDTGASRIVLGGASLVSLLPEVIALSSVPVLDPHRAAIRKAMILVSDMPTDDMNRVGGEAVGLSSALTGLLTSGFNAVHNGH